MEIGIDHKTSASAGVFLFYVIKPTGFTVLSGTDEGFGLAQLG
jgi:hypothetical protein